MSYALGFAPWLIFMVIASGNHPARGTLLLACLAAFAAEVVLVVLSASRKLVSSLDIGGLIFFPLMAVLTLLLPTATTDAWSAAILQAGLTIVVGVGIVLGRPFTMVYAKAAAPPEVWDTPEFIGLNKRLTLGWFVGFVVMTASSVVGAFFPPASTTAFVFNWAIPVGLVVVVMKWQESEISRQSHQETSDSQRTLPSS